MDAATATIGDDDRRLLIAHYGFYRGLDSGGRAPTTPAQRHFIAVCRGTAPPETDHERAYSRFKRAVTAAGVNEAAVVASKFVLPPHIVGEDTDDVGEVTDIPLRPCIGCGRPIPPERLEAIPDATRCVLCQQRTESTASDWHVSEVECPRCASHGVKSRMVWCTARDPAKFSGYFLGCSRFPECRYIDQS
jgi:Prokaryotic dksA/traR C4-type zinc finger